MPLSGFDAVCLGGVSSSRSTGVPTSEKFRFNTARLMDMLGIAEFHLPPVYHAAEKILQDLQLPSNHFPSFSR